MVFGFDVAVQPDPRATANALLFSTASVLRQHSTCSVSEDSFMGPSGV